MITRNRFLIGLSAVGFALLCFGCYSTPFVPIAVPDSHYMQKPLPVDKSQELEELKKLHHITAINYKISAGDTFAIMVDGHENLCRPNVMVMPDGAISVSPIGLVKINDMTISEASNLLSEKYKEYIVDCNIVLEPIALKNFTVTVTGTVKAPGIYPFAFGVTRLNDAIAMAGGVVSSTEQRILLSDLEGAYIARDGKVLPVDFEKAIIDNNPLYNIPLMNGDYIYIPSLENSKVTVLGEVGSPTCVTFQPNLTLLQTLGFVGGLKDTKARELKVIRGGLSNPTVYNINIVDMQRGRTVDFELKPNDIVFVPKSGLSEWNTIISQILPSFQLLNSMAGPFGNPVSTLY